MNTPHNDAIQIITKDFIIPSTGAISYAYLEHPEPSEHIPNKDSKVKISGWALTKRANENFKIIIRQNEIAQEYYPTISRPDVLHRFENGLGKGTPRERCGFDIEATLHTPLEIYLQTDSRPYLWKHIRLTSNSNDLSILAWHNFITNNLEQISEEQSLSLQKLDTDFIENFITGKSKRISKPSDASRIHSLSKSEQACLQNFISETKSENFSATLIKSTQASNAIKLPHPFKEGISTSNESYHYINGRTLLRFTTDDNETFFLIQYVSSGDAIFFPNRDIIVLDYHVSYKHVIEHIQALCKNFNYVLEKCRSNNRKFGGIIASNGRPYHFYYDALPAINILNKEKLLHTIPQIFMYSGGDFLSIKDLYRLDTKETVLNSSEIEKSTRTNQSFYIQSGIRYQSNNNIDHSNITDLDKKICDYSTRNTTYSAKKIIEETSKHFPLIWFGITGQKRSLIEQVETCTLLYKELSRVFPSLGIILDGWTSAITPTSRDEHEKKTDIKIAEQIKEQLPPSAAIYSVIGETTQTKIAVANFVDLFIANHSTGSLHVARFAQKPGISHLNKSMNRNDHIHYKTREIPNSEITDINLGGDLQSDFISYSISPQKIIELAKKILDEETWYTNRASLLNHKTP